MAMTRGYFLAFAFRATVTIGLVLLPACDSGTGGGSEVSCSPKASNTIATVSCSNDIVPMFQAAGCLTSACHGGEFPSSSYDLRTYESWFVSGADARRIGACEIVPGDPENSFLLEKLRSDNPRVGLQMPLERDPLTEEEIALVETWIREGAQDN